ncbi:MAG: hypothetical protein ACRECY_07710 [Phyllobacterium sp.]
MNYPISHTPRLFALLTAVGLVLSAAGPSAAAEQGHDPRAQRPGSWADQVGSPPADPPGFNRMKITPQTVLQIRHEDLKANFDRAAGPGSNLLTAAAARRANWGFISDHFAEIDHDKDGFVTLSEVTAFMDARAPGSKAVPAGAVQIVE